MPSSVGAIAERVLENSRLYDGVQRVMGVKTVNRHLERLLAELHETSPRVLDVGGGTGSSVDLWPTARLYCCLDPDAAKLTGFRRRLPGGIGVQSDGAVLPFPSGAFDLVLCRAVSHHLTLETLAQVFAEVARVLAPQGRLMFLDALDTRRVRSRLLWMIDRGSHPRTWDDIAAVMNRSFEVETVDRFAVQHAYAAALARPRAAVS